MSYYYVKAETISAKNDKVVSAVLARCQKGCRRQYTLKDLNELRHLKVCREMPTNIVRSDFDIFAPGLGLGVVSTNRLTSRREVRYKQIQIAKDMQGYKNYIKLIPKHHRINQCHPSTPTDNEIIQLSKRNFDKTVKEWKRAIHSWDNINTESDIPRHLCTGKIMMDRINSISYVSVRNRSEYVWSPKKSPSKSSKQAISRSYGNGQKHDEVIKRMAFDDDDEKDKS